MQSINNENIFTTSVNKYFSLRSPVSVIHHPTPKEGAPTPSPLEDNSPVVDPEQQMIYTVLEKVIYYFHN